MGLFGSDPAARIASRILQDGPVEDEADELFGMSIRIPSSLRALIDELAEQSGYRVLGGFNLPKSDWWEGFYLPLQSQVAELRAKNAGNVIAESVYDFHDTEIEMYRRYHRYYGYRFVLLQRDDPQTEAGG